VSEQARVERLSGWYLTERPRSLSGCQNGHSFHRLAGVKMGLLREPCALNERDRTLGRRRVYTRQTLLAELEPARLRPTAWGGVFFKPSPSNRSIPKRANQLFAVCEGRP
jgi:hypothetical protein